MDSLVLKQDNFISKVNLVPIKTFCCEHCPKVFSTRLSFLLHMRSHNSQQIFKCQHCQENFCSNDMLETHLRTHTGPFVCTICAKQFAQQGNLERHLRTHNWKKLYACPHCPKKFTLRSICFVHSRTHTVAVEKPYSCFQCGNAFAQLDQRKSHLCLPLVSSECVETELKNPGMTGSASTPLSALSESVSGGNSGSSVKLRASKYNLTIPSPTVVIPNKFPCTACSRVFASLRAVRIHCKVIHCIGYPGNYVSPNSGKIIPTPVAVKKQRGRPPKLLSSAQPSPSALPIPMPSLATCDFCKKKFKGHLGLKIHLNTHKYGKGRIRNRMTNVKPKPFNCVRCGLHFGLAWNAKRHLKICGQLRLAKPSPNGRESFDPQRDKLKPAISKNIAGQMTNYYACSHCPLKFAKPSLLHKHLLLNTDHRTLICKFCQVGFGDEDACKKHQLTHSKQAPYSCNICSEVFPMFRDHCAHFSKFHSKKWKRFCCQVCRSRFNFTSCLLVHLRVHTKDRHFQCQICENKFIQVGHLVTHLRKIHGINTAVNCTERGSQFFIKSSLPTHLRDVGGMQMLDPKAHGPTAQETLNPGLFIQTVGTGEGLPLKYSDSGFICDYCHVGFKSLDSATHLLAHTGPTPYSCNQCEKQFPISDELASHCRESHSAVKSFSCHECQHRLKSVGRPRVHFSLYFKCDECSSMFTRKDCLESHMQTHCGEKRFARKICAQTFRSSDHFSKHLPTTSIPLSEVQKICKLDREPESKHKIFDLICYNCKTGFRSLADKIKHVRTHNPETPYKCNQCHQLFSSSADLSSHERTHTVKSNFLCDVCPKRCSYGFSLMLHMRIHTGNLQKRKPGCPRKLNVFNYEAVALGHKGIASLNDKTSSDKSCVSVDQLTLKSLDAAVDIASSLLQPQPKLAGQEIVDNNQGLKIIVENNCNAENGSGLYMRSRRTKPGARQARIESNESLSEQWQEFLEVIKGWA